METGICVRTEGYFDSKGRSMLRAFHKRDHSLTWKVTTYASSISYASDHMGVLELWMKRFTQVKSTEPGYNVAFRVAARGGDLNGYYFVLVPST